MTITKNGHDRLVVIAADELSDEEVALIATAEVPAEHAYLDDELGDWQA